MEFFHTVEFYVILLVIAAFCVGLLAIPSGSGPVETGFADGLLSFTPEGEADPEPRIEILCQEDGSVKILRYGLPADLDSAATVALAVSRKGFDISIEERITPSGRPLLASEATPVNTAVFHLPVLARERYHIKYNSDPTSSFTTLTLHNRPGLRSTRILRKA